MIYSSISRALADARFRASSQAQLRMVDLVAEMVGDELEGFKGFRKDLFLEECNAYYGVYIDNTIERIERT